MGGTLNHVVFRPPSPPSYGGDTVGFSPLLKYKDEGGRACKGFFINRGSPTVLLYSHGNAEDLGTSYNLLYKKSQKLGISVFAYEYSGYGPDPQCLPDEKALLRDIEAAYNYLIDVLNFNSKNIIAYGRSLGTGPSCFLAAKYNLRALILESGFTSILGIVSGLSLLSAFNMFKNEKKITLISCKILFIHGMLDRLIPPSHSQDMYKLSKHEESDILLIADAGHNNVEFKGKNLYYDRLKMFIDSSKPSVAHLCSMPNSMIISSDQNVNTSSSFIGLRRFCTQPVRESFVTTSPSSLATDISYETFIRENLIYKINKCSQVESDVSYNPYISPCRLNSVVLMNKPEIGAE